MGSLRLENIFKYCWNVNQLRLKVQLKMDLPHSQKVPIHYLIRAFEETTTSYKYLWLWSLINQILKSENQLISVDEIVSEMLILASGPIIENKLSFGRQDKINSFISSIMLHYYPNSSPKCSDVQNCIKENMGDSAIQDIIKNISRFVPFRMLTPWFSNELKGHKDAEKNNLIVDLSNQYFSNAERRPLYRFDKGMHNIEVDTLWAEYIRENYKILEGFILWHFAGYLNKNNPNVLNIQEKLKNDNKRDLALGRRFWNIYLNIRPLKCIYCDGEILQDNFSLDHYLPWSFCSHDYLWNLIPTRKEINSSKSDCIPNTEIYLDKFIFTQLNALRAVSEVNSDNKLLEDYAIYFNDSIESILEYDREKFLTEYRNRLIPQIQIAKNIGFRTDFLYCK